MKKHVHCRMTTYASLFVILVLPLLAGCRAEEQDRITMYEPGVYMGKKQPPLTEDQVKALRYRTRGQSGSTSTVGSK